MTCRPYSILSSSHDIPPLCPLDTLPLVTRDLSPLVPLCPSSHQLTSALVSCLINTAIRIYIYDLYQSKATVYVCTTVLKPSARGCNKTWHIVTEDHTPHAPLMTRAVPLLPPLANPTRLEAFSGHIKAFLLPLQPLHPTHATILLQALSPTAQL